MRKYELMTIFPLNEEKSKQGLEELHAVLSEYGAEIEKEDVFGDRDLTYEVKGETRGHFVLLIVSVNPGKIVEIENKFKINKNLLKHLFSLIEDKKNK